MSEQKYIAIGEFAERAGISYRSAWRLTRSGRVPVLRFPGLRRVLVCTDALKIKEPALQAERETA